MVIKNSVSSHPAGAKSWHKTNFFPALVLTSTFWTLRLPLNCISSFLALKHTIIAEMALGIKSKIIVQPLKEDCLEAMLSNPFPARPFAQLKMSLLLPLTSSPLAKHPSLCSYWRSCFLTFCFFLYSVVCSCLSWRASLRLEAIHQSRPYLCKVRKNAFTRIVYCTDIYWIKHPSPIFPDHFDLWSSAVYVSSSSLCCLQKQYTYSQLFNLILFVKHWMELISRHKPVKQMPKTMKCSWDVPDVLRAAALLLYLGED